MVTLNLSSDYELDNSIMFQMPHGTIKNSFFFILDELFEKNHVPLGPFFRFEGILERRAK